MLVLSELVSNAIKYARPLNIGKIIVNWHIKFDSVWVGVTDGGASTRPIPMRPSVSALGGRGLDIVSTLAREWGVHDGADGTTVWAVLRLTGRRHPSGPRADR